MVQESHPASLASLSLKAQLIKRNPAGGIGQMSSWGRRGGGAVNIWNLLVCSENKLKSGSNDLAAANHGGRESKVAW